MFSDSVWERMGEADVGNAQTLNWRVYVALISLFTLGGLAAFAGLAWLTLSWKLNIWELLGVGLAIPIAGIFIASSAERFATAFLGYAMIVCGLGLVSGPGMNMHSAGAITSALFATLGTTVVTSFIGICSKRSLEHWGTYLLVGLVALILVRIAQIFLLSAGVSALGGAWAIVPYLGAVLFSAFIVYDWNRAMHMPWTLRNSLDASIAIFLDIVNLFQLLLDIFGMSDKD